MSFNIEISKEFLYQKYPDLLEKILYDNTTKENIIWATDNYEHFGVNFQKEASITVDSVIGIYNDIIRPRSLKDKYIQTIRTKDKAEVFTPSWICNKQNNLIDEAWFGYKNVFNIEKKSGWKTIQDKVRFPKNRNWMDYIENTRLEICCGEAPYLVSRYDSVTGELIPLKERIGILDRKLRVISENVDNESDWIEWVKKAYMNIYGYEFQGDNLILARMNLLLTFIENFYEKFKKEPEVEELYKIIDIICWNIWQMDGLSMMIPFHKKEEEEQQLSIFNFNEEEEHQLSIFNKESKSYTCKIYDWKAEKCVEFQSFF